MTGTKDDMISYRIARAKDTYDDALILAERKKWIPLSTGCIMPLITRLWPCFLTLI
jgi:hypothetical protein